MSEDDWKALRRLFDAVCDLPPETWEDRLQALTADAALRRETLALLRSATRALRRAEGAVDAAIEQALGAEIGPGDMLGPWRVERRLGSGGMGVVLLAERADGLYAQRTAIKVLHGLPDAGAVERLAEERRILAGLQHPHIARLYDGGTTPQGQPYLVMEYVDGRPVDAYCREAGLGLEARLQLFLKICGAVQAAHARLVVHCDLKPANVLVREDGEPVLLDFGISRLLTAGGADAGRGHGWTPGYAAPEVVAGQAPGIAGDVYGLGVLLLELVAGRALDRPREDDRAAVPAPSAWAPGGLPWRRRLRGDLDAIVARACAHDPDARYATVDALAEDVRRHSRLLPVRARAGERSYRARRLLRRRWRETAAGALALALCLGFVWRLDGARARAEHEAEVSRQVGGFLVSMFEAADPRARGARGGETIAAREVLDRAAERIDGELDASPEVRARLQGVIGMAYRNMGDIPRSLPLLRAAADGLAAAGGPHLDEASRILNMLSATYANNRDGEAGERLARRSLALLGPDYPDSFRVAQAYNSLGLSLVAQQRYDAAEDAFRQALMRHEAAGRERFVGVTLDNLGVLHRRRGQLEAAERAFRRSGPIFLREHGELSYEYWTHRTEHALAVADAGRLAEARAMLERNLEAAPKLFGEHSVYYASEHVRLASVLLRQGDYTGAEPLAAAGERLFGEVMGTDSFVHSLALEATAALAEARGDPARAEAAYRRVLAVREASVGAAHPDTLDASLQLGLFLARAGRVDADAFLQRAFDGWLPRLPADSANAVRIRQARAEWLTLAGRLGEAERALREVDADARAAGPHHAVRQRALLAAWRQRNGPAAAAVAAWREAVDAASSLYGADAAVVAAWRVPLAESLAAAGDAEGASLQAARAAAVLSLQSMPQSPLLARLERAPRIDARAARGRAGHAAAADLLAPAPAVTVPE
ncbi:serine/threonine-protein kinase [Luteimonas huabeiensis]|uniref:serine/threonine-protein kinase n=1 Tax=Luteimonas huabeiensis TaxID=1244513 RepID=UPI00046788B1|nr:serine/threonine-protein kinase [Luteimonas huabeiensis]